MQGIKAVISKIFLSTLFIVLVTSFHSFANELHLAANKKDLGRVKELVSQGFDVNAKDGKGNTPLTIAAVYSSPDVVEFLLDQGAAIEVKNKRGATPLLFSILLYNRENPFVLVNRGANVNAKDNEGLTPLTIAIMKGSRGVIDLLLENGADVNAKDNQGRTPLMHAARLTRDIELIKLLLSKGSDVNVKDNKGFTAAMYARNTAIAEILGPINFGRTALMQAAKNNDLKAIQQLIINGADVNAKDAFGDDPLLYAIKSEHVEAAKLLLENGADVNSRDKNDPSPLMGATMKNNKELVELLIDHGADINAKAHGMMTALMVASMGGHQEIYDLLIEKGAKEITCPDETETEIQQAIKATWTKMSKSLITGKIETALTYFSEFSRDQYRRRLSGLGKEKLKSIFGSYETIVVHTIDEGKAECGAIRKEKSGTYSYPVVFVRDLDCVWRISGI